MPGIVVFRRRWSVGSDDLVVPALFLVILHIIWILVLGVTLGVVEFDRSIPCSANLHDHVLGYLVILSVCVVVEAAIVWVSMRGTILNTEPRSSMQYLLYTRVAILALELAWLIVGVVWFSQHYQSCEATTAKRAVLGIIVCNWAVMLSVLISLWCTFDTAGRSWVKMKRYQESVKVRENRAGHKRRSGSRRRNWRHRKAMRAYEESWDRRCRILFCCVKEDRNRNSFSEIAKLFTEFFRDLDVVPSDIVAGLVLLRKQQKLRRKFVVQQGTNDVYQFLSGVPITPRSQFVSLKNPDVLADFKNVIHYMRYALAAYGWPLYMMMNAGTGLCKIMPHLSCCICCRCCVRDQSDGSEVLEDNCCQCNVAALQMLLGIKEVELVYVTYHVDIGETPFFVAVDHGEKKIVISIRGTLSLQDVLTDLKADAEQLPVDPIKEDWLGHKGMVQAAVYIKKKIKDEMLLSQAFGKDLERGTQQYDLVCVGHSLGAGTAAILAILLQQEYPNLHCYSYSPPGGLLSENCVRDTKHFITSVVVGKDIIPRIGLHQLETMRQDLINVIKQSTEPKWKTIAGSVMCCCQKENQEFTGSMYNVFENLREEKENRYFAHPSDSQIALTSHTPLFLPGKIIHVVRNHPRDKKLCKRAEPVYQAIWADNKDFDEVLISPTMVNDHMPDNVMEALEKVLTNVSPAKPTRRLPEAERKSLLPNTSDPSYCPQCESSPHLLHSQDGATHTHCLLGGAPNNTDLSQELTPSVAYNLGSETNSMSWDYATLPVDHTRKHPKPEICRSERTKSYPPPILKLKPGMKLDLMGNPEWVGSSREVLAPLASPETLSEASSIDTINAKRLSDGFTRLQQCGFLKMSTIPPSPVGQTRADTYHYTVPAPSPVDYGDTPRDEFTCLSTNIPPIAQSTPIKPDLNPAFQRTDSTLVDLSMEMSADTTQCRSEEDTSLGDLGVSPLKDLQDSVVYVPETDQTNLTDIEKRIEGKLNDIDANDPYRLTYGDLTADTVGSQDSFALHSPDSASNQCLYGECQGFYSPAGRGYPHGAYMNEWTECEEPVQNDVDSGDENAVNGDANVDNDNDENTTNQAETCHQNGPTNEKPVRPTAIIENSDLPGTIPSLIPEVIITDSSPCEPEPDEDCSFMVEPTSTNYTNCRTTEDAATPTETTDDRTISRSSSDDSIPDTDSVHQPLICKRASWASSGSQSSRRSLTNGHSSTDSDDRPDTDSAQHVGLLDGQATMDSQRSKVNCITMADGHSGFGESYYV